MNQTHKDLVKKRRKYLWKAAADFAFSCFSVSAALIFGIAAFGSLLYFCLLWLFGLAEGFRLSLWAYPLVFGALSAAGWKLFEFTSAQSKRITYVPPVSVQIGAVCRGIGSSQSEVSPENLLYRPEEGTFEEALYEFTNRNESSAPSEFLVRGSEQPAVSPGELLRAAHAGKPASAEELLRPNERANL